MHLDAAGRAVARGNDEQAKRHAGRAVDRLVGRSRAQRRDDEVLVIGERNKAMKAVRRALTRMRASSKKAWARTRAEVRRL